jgi:O-antigen ligase
MLAVELFGRRILSHRLLYGTFAAVCLLLAQSSTMYIAGAVVVLWWIVVKTRRYWPVVVSALLFLVAFLVAMGLPMYILNSFGQERLDSGSGRTIIWDYATRPLFPDNWLLGFGSQFLNEAYRLRYLPPNQQQAVHAHNQFVQAFGEGGLVGLAFFLLLVGALIYIAFKSFAFDGGMRSALVVTFLASMMTEVMVKAGGTPGVGGLLFLLLIAGGETALGHRNRDESALPIGVSRQKKGQLSLLPAHEAVPGYRTAVHDAAAATPAVVQR